MTLKMALIKAKRFLGPDCFILCLLLPGMYPAFLLTIGDCR